MAIVFKSRFRKWFVKELIKAFDGENDVVVITFDENHPLQEEIMTKYNIDGYPTIFKCKMQNGKLTEPEIYDGPRTYSGLVTFLTA